MAAVVGTPGNDFIHRAGDGNVPPAGFTNIPQATAGDDQITPGTGDDIVFGDRGNDTVTVNVPADGTDQVNLGDGSDSVSVVAASGSQIRLTFTSSEVGNDNPNESGGQANQDGGLAVRLQLENGSDGLTGPVSRFDDEGISFVASAGVTFDVRDLVSGVGRGDRFEVVTLGTNTADVLSATDPQRAYYFNGGQGADTITGGVASDFLVGGAGADNLDGGAGNNSFIGGAGADTITGGAGDDTAILNISTDGADSINLGDGTDTVSVSAATPGQVRLTFTSSEVGNGAVNDAGNLANQDGGLAVRLQAEGDQGTLTGPITRVEDEGVTFVAGAGVTFDIRDITTGVARGDQFGVASLGRQADDTLTAVLAGASYYFNAGGGNDRVAGGTANDFLVGGTGDDVLDGGGGDDTILGGGGNDTVAGGTGNDTISAGDGDDTANLNVTTDGGDAINLEGGGDVVNVAAAAANQVRLTFTSAAVGNSNALEGNSQPNQDGGLAVRLQAEDGADGLVGPVTRVDDEGITFVAGAGVTIDVRDLVSGVARGDRFEVVSLGTELADNLVALQASRPYYFNGGQGADTITGGAAADFLVGGGGDDILNGGDGDNTFLGGGGGDTVTGGAGNDAVLYNISADGPDLINLLGGADTVNVSANAPTQVRLTFTSAEVGNDSATDAGTQPNQDGGLAVRLRAEDGMDGLVGPVTRADDEGVSFVAGAGVTFDVRDLTSGAARGDQFGVVTLGTSGNDTLGAFFSTVPYYFNGGLGNDTIEGGTANDFLVGGAGNDTLRGDAGNDTILGGANGDRIVGGAGADTVSGGDGDDTIDFNISTDGADAINSEQGNDTVNVTAPARTEVRLSFTSTEVGNGTGIESGIQANQDGGLAVRLQAENGADGLVGDIARADDEGVSFVGGRGVTFDVRDLVSGVSRGTSFQVVKLGTTAGEVLRASELGRSYYLNGGVGDDTVTGGRAVDVLVGGAGNDTLRGEAGNDTILGGANGDRIIGGTGADTINGGDGDDVIDFNISTDGADAINGEKGNDTVNVTAPAKTQVRLTFTSAEVGNANALDGGTRANQDGGLAVRLQAERSNDTLAGGVTRVDDEGISFVAATGVTFDVRDLVSGAARGDQFGVVKLGTTAGEVLRASEAGRSYYMNGGAGDDAITGARADDFLAGGGGGDVLDGAGRRNSLLGGTGADTFVFSTALNATRNVDTILDMEAGVDTLRLTASVFTGLTAGELDASAFKDVAKAALDGDDRILYNSSTGTLSFDRDGSGTEFRAVCFAVVDNKAAIGADDFIVV